MIPPSRFSPSPCRSQEVANSCLSSVWSQGLTQGLSDHSVKFCTWKVMCCVLVKTMISTRRLPPNNETCRIWFTLTGILWRWQLVVGLFGRQNHRALQCSCYFSQGHQRAVCSCLWQKINSNLMQRANSLEKTLMLGKIKGRRRRGWQRMRRLDGITDSMDIGLGRLQ